jgi:UDP-galactopyranose mutase
MDERTAIIVFSHLRWNSVFQRPHHLLSRIARMHRVLFIEEPVACDGPSEWKYETPVPGVVVCIPYTSCRDAGFSGDQIPAISRMLPPLLQEFRVEHYYAWLYTPMALPLLDCLAAQVVIYDCMDALDSFLNAPPLLCRREDELLGVADVVFTGGPSLFRRLQARHDNVHCFSSSVDAQHFHRATEGNSEAEDQLKLPRPRIGFFGVIDERIDLEILSALAEARPDWQIIMVGPIVKIMPDSLPRHSNMHYFGQRNYADLPSYLAGWDVCMMPFARNDATRYISPTKVLEYMAAERPIVSTRITDVAEPYGHVVYLADTADEFVSACEEAMSVSDEERKRQAAIMRRIISGTSWDLTVEQMLALIEKCSQSRVSTKEPTRLPGRRPQVLQHPTVNRSRRKIGDSAKTVVIGAGPTGLSAAYHLDENAILLEQNQQIGGWCRSINENGFTFDYAGHIMFSNDPYVHEMYNLLLGNNVHWQDREAWIYSNNVYTRYPFQGALYGLPPEVIKECIMGAIEARFGTTSKSAGSTNGSGKHGHNGSSLTNGHGNGQCPTKLSDCCADGILESTAALVKSNGEHHANGTNGTPKSETFEEFIYRVWGAGIAKHFAIPYNRKLWAVPLSEMETSWLGGRVPMPDLEEMIEGALRPVPKPMGPNARFGYPLHGGFQALMDGFMPLVKHKLRLGARVAAVSPRGHVVELTDGRVVHYDQLISTMPLPVLIRSMGKEAPAEIREAAAQLRYVSVRCVHLGIGRENLTEKHWIYYPEDTVFHRIFVQGNASPHCNPAGGFGLTCEITYSEHKPLPCDGEALIERCIADCQDVGIFSADDPIWAATQVDLPHAYVVYDHERPRIVKLIREWMLKQDIILAGRYSEWEYYNSDHAFLAGKKAAETVQELRSQAVDAPHASRGIALPPSNLTIPSSNATN